MKRAVIALSNDEAVAARRPVLRPFVSAALERAGRLVRDVDQLEPPVGRRCFAREDRREVEAAVALVEVGVAEVGLLFRQAAPGNPIRGRDEQGLEQRRRRRRQVPLQAQVLADHRRRAADDWGGHARPVVERVEALVIRARAPVHPVGNVARASGEDRGAGREQIGADALGLEDRPSAAERRGLSGSPESVRSDVGGTGNFASW